mmetsp:Transcript_52026/g.139334  ORF Transcript_52026/g.139334 Transcript_52026/m.139334 type:complete len:239 (-) Transcript_52026:56-772(-)
MQAERLRLGVGDRLVTLADDSPCGPHFLVLVRGRATVEMTSNGIPVQNIIRGTPLSEGLVAENGACIRAVTSCEAYRVRHSDFRTAVGADVRWLGDFLNLERQSWEALRERLKSAKGVGRLFKIKKKRSVSVSGGDCYESLLFDSAQPSEEWSVFSSLSRPSTSPIELSHRRLPLLGDVLEPRPSSSPSSPDLARQPCSPKRSLSSSRALYMRQHNERMAGIRSLLQLRKELRDRNSL